MMVRFSGRSEHTTRIKSKPIPEGYQVLFVCDIQRYVWNFMFVSRIADDGETLEEIDRFNKTENRSWHLIKRITKKSSEDHCVFIDNRFSSINLFAHMKSKGMVLVEQCA